MTEEPKQTILNRMKDCGNGRHVGWWEEDHFGPTQLLIEVDRHVIFSCCEGPRAEKRIHFITSREKATEIAHALARALGIELRNDADV